jgi:hypothetical protein
VYYLFTGRKECKFSNNVHAARISKQRRESTDKWHSAGSANVILFKELACSFTLEVEIQCGMNLLVNYGTFKLQCSIHSFFHTSICHLNYFGGTILYLYVRSLMKFVHYIIIVEWMESVQSSIVQAKFTWNSFIFSWMNALFGWWGVRMLKLLTILRNKIQPCIESIRCISSIVYFAAIIQSSVAASFGGKNPATTQTAALFDRWSQQDAKLYNH